MIDNLYYFLRFTLPEFFVEKITDFLMFLITILNRNKDRVLYRQLTHLAQSYNPENIEEEML